MSPARDTWLVFSRAMTLSLRNPVWVIIGLTQPIIYLALFGPLLEKVVKHTPGFGSDNAWNFFTPGMLIQLAMFACGFVGFSIVGELREGVVERMRVTPANRMALLLGRVMRDVVVLVVQAAVIIAVASLFGLEPHWAGIAGCLLLVAMLGVVLASTSYALGLILRSEDALAPLFNFITVPLLLLSGILLPMSRLLAPGWLYDASRANPLVYVVEAARALFAGDVDTRPVFEGVGVTAVLAALAVAFGVRTFRRVTG